MRLHSNIRHAAAALALLAALQGCGGAGAPPPPAAATPTVAACDEACLKGFVDQYLVAVAARDPARAQLAADVRFTENTRPLKIGDGFWATATQFGPYRNYFIDTSTQQAGVFAVMSEHGIPGLFTLRIKVQGGLITEAETIVVRKQTMGRFLRTDATAAKPVWNAPVAQPLTREQLISIVNPYFDALKTGDGNAVAFDDACQRIENGTQTAGTTPQPPAPTPPGAAAAATPASSLGFQLRGCREGFNSGATKYIQEVDPRRFVIVNEKQGLVFGFFMFRHPGTLTEYDAPGRGKVKVMEGALNPMDVIVAELFKVQDGRITDIEAQMVSLPYRSDTGWDK
ncbi:MAG: hypothetical protein ABW278_16115 [Steroidobacteraceae bacterium]